MLLKNKYGKFGIILSPLILAAGMGAQTISSVRISAVPAGPIFYVDGQPFSSPVTLLWPQGSKHKITTILTQDGIVQRTHFEYAGVTTNLGTPTSDPITVTADPALTWIQVNFAMEVEVDLNYYTCPPGTEQTTCPPTDTQDGTSPGTVVLNSQAFIQNGNLFVTPGSTVSAEAKPNKGWVFVGWLPVPGSGNTSQAFFNSWVVNGPMVLYPLFRQARPISVTVMTTPPGLQVLVDRTPHYSGYQQYWGFNTVHQLGGISPQHDDQGRLWVFDSWNDAGAYSHSYTVPYAESAVTLTARYVPGTLVSFFTNPPGLQLSVDGNPNSPDYTYAWAPGTTHGVVAPDTQTDLAGHKYQFMNWSNGGAATQQITALSDPTKNRYTANYQMMGTVNIHSTPAGVPMQIDGKACTTPCSVDRAVGAAVQVSAPANAAGGNGTRLDFDRWSDSSSANRTLTAAPDAQTVTASYNVRYRLTASANQPQGVSWRFQPSSSDSYFAAKASVTVAINPRPGFRFLNWRGDASGQSTSVTMVMDGPHSVQAELDEVPYVDPEGIRNGAAETPDRTVAPGSVVTIYGVNLSSNVVSAPGGRLEQTLDNVLVRTSDALLPLYFVSPVQINAQLPFGVPEGDETLTVHVEGKPESSATFHIRRNAPGLFFTARGHDAFAVAAHQDGSMISTGSPARRGEVVSLYATGLGPYSPMPLDGFPVPSNIKYTLADHAKLVVGGHPAEPVWAGAAAGRIGIAIVQLKIDDSVPHAASVALKVSVNGHDSNTVLLPVQ